MSFAMYKPAAMVRQLDSLSTVLSSLKPLVEVRSFAPRGERVKQVRLAVRGMYRSKKFSVQIITRLQGQLPTLKKISANSYTGTLFIQFNYPQSISSVVSVVQGVVQQLIATRISGESGELAGAIPRGKLWHGMSEDEVLWQLGSSRGFGLSDLELSKRRRYYGINSLRSGEEDEGFLAIFIRQFTNVPVGILLGAGLISVLSGSWLDGCIILGVVGINACIGFITDECAQRTLRSLEHRGQTTVVVLRNGKKMITSAEELLPGDIFAIRPGLVPADGRILIAQDLYVDEALLTGESIPQEKAQRSNLSGTTPLHRRSNMLYMGSEIASGAGLAVVTATGMMTEIGQIKRLAELNEKPETAMQRDLRRLTSSMVWGALGVCGGIVLIGLLRGQALSSLLHSAVALAVAAVPEGLPAVGTTTLAFGVSNLRRKNIFARNLRSIEALGTVDTICFDKTGTITWNRMVVAEVCTAEHRWSTEQQHTAQRPPAKLLEIAALCNTVTLVEDKPGEAMQLIGSATEKALVHYAIDKGIDIRQLKKAYPTLGIEQRTPSRRFMVSRHRGWMACKGSPPQVLDLCTHLLLAEQQVVLMSSEQRRELAAHNQALGAAALRVLALAYREENASAYIWVGLVGLKDPPRSGITELIARLHGAGIHPLMITGDQQATARAIAEEIALSGSVPLCAHTGEEWARAGVLLFQRAAGNLVHVFSEVSPGQKLEIVKALQHQGKMVAMVGDGINDAPALKGADLGISLIENAANAAKECADIVVDDSAVGNIYDALAYGRTVRRNLRKAISYLWATNVSEILVMLGGHVSGLGAPLLPLQLLWINIMTDVFPSLAFALSPPENDIMKQAAEASGMPLLTRNAQVELLKQGMILSGSALLPFAYYQRRLGSSSPGLNNSVAFCSLSLSQLVYAFARSPSGARNNPYVGLAVGGGVALLGAGIYLPFLRSSLGTTMLGLKDLSLLAPVVGVSYWLNLAKYKGVKT